MHATIAGVMGVVEALVASVLAAEAGGACDLHRRRLVTRCSTRNARPVFIVGAARRKNVTE